LDFSGMGTDYGGTAEEASQGNGLFIKRPSLALESLLEGKGEGWTSAVHPSLFLCVRWKRKANLAPRSLLPEHGELENQPLSGSKEAKTPGRIRPLNAFRTEAAAQRAGVGCGNLPVD
jgi:hypothetical protein